MMSFSRRLVAVVLSASLPAQAEVLVVGPSGGPAIDFTDVQPAVNAAADGDTILVRDGTYSAFVVHGKGLAIVAEGSGARLLAPAIYGGPNIRISGLAAGQRALVRGLSLDTGVVVVACAGSVWFDQTTVGGSISCSVGGTHGAYVWSSPRVTFTRCVLRGESAEDPFFTHPSADGVRIESSTVQLFDCQVTGGWGQDARNSLVSPLPGGAGLRLEASTVTVAGCTITGGEGGLGAAGFGIPMCGAVNASGGAGIQFVGGPSTLRAVESTALGGVADLQVLCPGQTAPQGPPIAGTGTIVALPGFARHLSANSPVRGGETVTFDLHGQPGETPLLLLSLLHEPVGLLNGSLLIGLPPTDAFVLPSLPASGQASLSFTVPSVEGALASLTLYAQAAFLDATPAVWLGAGTTVVLLDSGA